MCVEIFLIDENYSEVCIFSWILFPKQASPADSVNKPFNGELLPCVQLKQIIN